MANILSGLPVISFSENVPDIIIGGATSTAKLTVTLDSRVLIDKITLTPDRSKQIVIYTRQFVRNLTPLNPIETFGNFGLPSIKVEVFVGIQLLSQTCKLIPGGVAFDIADMPGWLDKNFLTWQPQIVETTPEQPQWLFFVPNGRYSMYETGARLYTADGRTLTKTLQQVGNANLLMNNPVGFKLLWEKECEEQQVTPVAYDIFVRATSGAGWVELTSMAQRYRLRHTCAADTCFGFVNTLGGFDTLMTSGRILLKPEGENETFINQRVETELANTYTSYWEASTGYIESARQSAQFQDFLKSSSRWIYQEGAWVKIAIDEFKIEHTPRELNSYTFKYHLAERNEKRFYERHPLPDVQLPTVYFDHR